jgi:hypothetical protein
MFCPQCGEIIGSGPLDMRHACRAEGAARTAQHSLSRRIGMMLRRLARLGGFRRK